MRALGTPYAINAIRYDFIPGQGLQPEFIYHGTPSAIAQIRGALNNTWEFEHDVRSPRHELRVRQPPAFKENSGGFSLELREAINSVHKDLLEPSPDSPIAVAEEEILKIRRVIDGKDDLGTGEQFSLQALELYNLYQRGVRDRIVYQPVFQIQRTSERKHTWPNQTNGVSRIFTDSQMMADQGIQGLITWTMASTAYAADLEPTGFKYGWLKMMPWHDTVVGNRSSQNVEFYFGLWPLLLYKLAA